MTEKKIGKLLATEREMTGLTPLDIKKEIKIQPAQLRAIETATANYTIKSLQSLCKHLGYEVKIEKILAIQHTEK